MKIGLGIPQTGPLATRASLDAWIERVEGLGFSYITVSDHIVIPRSFASSYPYSETGEVSGWGACVDQFTYLAYLAAITKTARLVSSVTAPPGLALLRRGLEPPRPFRHPPAFPRGLRLALILGGRSARA